MNNQKHKVGENMRMILMTSFEHLRNDRTLSQQERGLLFNDLQQQEMESFHSLVLVKLFVDHYHDDDFMTNSVSF